MSSEGPNRFCDKCGTAVRPAANFCQSCGTELGQVHSAPIDSPEQRAIEDYDEAIRIDPQNARAFHNLYDLRGNVYADLGQYERAIQDLDEAIRLDPQDAMAYNNRGFAYRRLGQHQRAIEDFDEAIRIDPQNARAFCNRGRAYYDLSSPERAIEDYDEAIRLDPQDAMAYFKRGVAYGNLGQHERAIEDYDEAVRLDPENAKAYFHRGIHYCELGQYERAIQDLDEAIRLDPQDAMASHAAMTARQEARQEGARLLVDGTAGLSSPANSGVRDYCFTGILLVDLDDTLVHTNMIKPLRSQGRWGEVMRSLSQTSLPPKTRLFLEAASTHSPIYVVTSSPRHYAEALLDHHGLELQVLVAYHDTDRHKPFPDPILKAAELLGKSPQDCLYIGDQAHDIQAAHAAGTASIGLNWESLDGFENVEELVTDGLCTDWNQVHGILFSLGNDLDDDSKELAPATWVNMDDPNYLASLEEDEEARRDDRVGTTSEPPGRARLQGDANPENLASRYRDHLDSTWNGQDFAIFKYVPLRYRATSATELILDYKNNVPMAVDRVNQHAIGAVETQESTLRAFHERLSIVGIPSSKQGPCGKHLRATCEALLDHFDWLDDRIDSLVRTESVPSAHGARSGARPTTEMQRATIAYYDAADARRASTGPVIPILGMYLWWSGGDGRVIAINSKGVGTTIPTAYGSAYEPNQIAWGQTVRAANDDDSFTVGPLTKPKTASIIMVDDVITSSATSAAARQVLKAAAFEPVFGLFMARTVRIVHDRH